MKYQQMVENNNLVTQERSSEIRTNVCVCVCLCICRGHIGIYLHEEGKKQQQLHCVQAHTCPKKHITDKRWKRLWTKRRADAFDECIASICWTQISRWNTFRTCIRWKKKSIFFFGVLMLWNRPVHFDFS